jgi:ABC-2 type transport system ATP-binding protein
VGEQLALHGVTRRFGDRTALDDVSFTVRPGRTTGFIGANGAGKTTAMRVILGVLAADAGRVTMGGLAMTPAMRCRIGYLPEERGLYPRMRVLDQLVHLGRVHGMSTQEARRRSNELLELLGLAERSHDHLSTLSLGNQQRVQVAAALVHDPDLLVLDEPFSGLDPLAIDAMGSLLRERADAGVPVLFSSHQLELIERLCDDIVIIDEGRVVVAGESSVVRRSTTGRRYRLRVEVPGAGTAPAGSGPSEPVAPWVSALVAAVPGASLVSSSGDVLVLGLAPDADDQRLLAAAQSAGTVREFAPLVPTLAELYRELVR